jgi:soluble lytic murein transglycosylase-like protein
MKLRILGLFLVAASSGGAVIALGDTSVVTPTARAAPRLAGVVARAPVPCPIPNALRPLFRKAAEQARVPLPMLVAVARVESNLDPEAVSPAGAHGLLQVLPSTAADFDLDARVVHENVLAGAMYLRRMLDRFQSTELALAAYNAGPTAVERKGARPNDETVAYVQRVTDEWRRIVGCT